MKPVIETHALCKSYHGRPVVDHLNLTVPEGCVYGFLGPNGAGKSTTMKMLLGLVHPTGGSVELLGHTLNEANRIALLRQTGSLIESPSGYLHLTARENLSIVADLKDVDRKDISRVLEIVHLTKDADRKVGQYSLGMKQRLGIAMALLGSPKLLILDEPTNGLDPAGIQEMRSLIASMPQTTGATVLISSHLLGEIEQMVDQVGILNHGRLLFECSLQQLQKHSRGGILLRVLDAPKAAAVLQQQGVKTAAPADQPDTLQLPPLPDEALAALVCTLAESGVGVVGLTAQTKSLEDIFLSTGSSVQEITDLLPGNLLRRSTDLFFHNTMISCKKQVIRIVQRRRQGLLNHTNLQGQFLQTPQRTFRFRQVINLFTGQLAGQLYRGVNVPARAGYGDVLRFRCGRQQKERCRHAERQRGNAACKGIKSAFMRLFVHRITSVMPLLKPMRGKKSRRTEYTQKNR